MTKTEHWKGPPEDSVQKQKENGIAFMFATLALFAQHGGYDMRHENGVAVLDMSKQERGN